MNYSWLIWGVILGFFLTSAFIGITGNTFAKGFCEAKGLEGKLMTYKTVTCEDKNGEIITFERIKKECSVNGY